MPIDFSDPFDIFNPFVNSDFSIINDPDDGNNSVGQFANDGSDIWQGFYIDLLQPIDLDIEQVITLSFYQFDPNTHNVMVKLEGGINPDVEVVVENSGVGWEEGLSFNFRKCYV